MTGFGGGPKVVPAFRMMFVKDKPSMKARLMRLSELEGLTRLVPCHGGIVSEGAAAALKNAADAA